LPDLYDAFPKAEKEWKDFDFAVQAKAFLNRMKATTEHGKKVVVKPEHEDIVKALQSIAA
jgi:hypothetical protein